MLTKLFKELYVLNNNKLTEEKDIIENQTAISTKIDEIQRVLNQIKEEVKCEK